MAPDDGGEVPECGRTCDFECISSRWRTPSRLGRTVRTIVRNGKCLNSALGTIEGTLACCRCALQSCLSARGPVLPHGAACEPVASRGPTFPGKISTLRSRSVHEPRRFTTRRQRRPEPRQEAGTRDLKILQWRNCGVGGCCVRQLITGDRGRRDSVRFGKQTSHRRLPFGRQADEAGNRRPQERSVATRFGPSMGCESRSSSLLWLEEPDGA